MNCARSSTACTLAWREETEALKDPHAVRLHRITAMNCRSAPHHLQAVAQRAVVLAVQKQPPATLTCLSCCCSAACMPPAAQHGGLSPLYESAQPWHVNKISLALSHAAENL